MKFGEMECYEFKTSRRAASMPASRARSMAELSVSIVVLELGTMRPTG